MFLRKNEETGIRVSYTFKLFSTGAAMVAIVTVYLNSDDHRAICPQCRNAMTISLKYVAPPAAQEAAAGDKGGFVKGVVTYMVMDDLVVKPMSTISSIALLNRFNVKEIEALEEKAVILGMNEALKLLKTSLESKSVLTNVFMKSVGK
ncbi:unnamed protein product [Coffea canephora]|uniref:DH200=94 genomic scaffold, scaffold_2780 n=1 Tax=Coffea canephora TaxID=49390 RepID=A0A068VND5_COFCA|nr:unnamed protein product [Coffea canephora]